ncbi:hypothetical protein [Vreelandella arctica]|uniref:hypothetical protein n=1 Tax=Vreelandella arctica TaxID=3126499 RepID=UPI00300E2A7C|tara:strand:- start:2393 stop:2635 length:243 start_codon:yes stop_codon:yes gene_type:complete
MWSVARLLLYDLQNNVAQGLHAAPSELDLGEITNRTTRLTEGAALAVERDITADLIEICLDVVSESLTHLYALWLRNLNP